MLPKKCFINMHCPFCSGFDFSTLDTRPNIKKNHIRRRRICHTCNNKFTTIEIVYTLCCRNKSNETMPPRNKKKLNNLNKKTDEQQL